jgi:phosphohistidine phosphatase
VKTLFLVRHAKSSRRAPLPDRDRPLAERGERDARKMGRRIAKREVYPDLILSSPAERAITTARIMAKRLGYRRKDIVADERLYPGQARAMLSMLRDLDDRFERVMLTGHNPALADLAHRLSSKVTRMPTCSVAELAFETESWSRIGRATLASTTLDQPKKRLRKCKRDSRDRPIGQALSASRSPRSVRIG